MSFITKAVSSIFGGGSKPSMPAVPAPPAMRDTQAAAAEEARLRANAGRASTILAGEDENQKNAKRTLLGAGY